MISNSKPFAYLHILEAHGSDSIQACQEQQEELFVEVQHAEHHLYSGLLLVLLYFRLLFHREHRNILEKLSRNQLDW